MRGLLLITYALLILLISNSVPATPQHDASSSATASASSESFSLLVSNPLLPPARLKVYRGQWTPLLRQHLPITKRVLRGDRHVCRIEVEELAPVFSAVGHLEPKKFDCSFRDGEVRYFHEGSPLLSLDTVRVTIFFFRNNHSIIQTVDIPVDVEDPPKTPEETGGRLSLSRISGQLQLNVKSIKAASQSLSPDVLKIDYNPEEEECYLSFTRPDIEPPRRRGGEKTAFESQTGRPLVTPWWESNSGLWAYRLGRPPASGPAIGSSRRWPLFGHLVVAAFNRTAVDQFEHECHEALLKGYRYLHRKPNSPETDYVPLQVTIWRKLPGGGREFVTRESHYLRVNIAGARKLEPPVVRIFRQVNLTHIGGSFSVLPKDCIHVVNTEMEDLLEVNVTKVQGPLYAQLVNLRDPTRPVLSFRIAELRKGLIALQLLNYAEMPEKIFTLTMVAIDPFMQVSGPVTLRLVSRLQPVFSNLPLGTAVKQKSFVFQVFSLPLFSFTGATSIVQKYNLQVVGYIDESMVRFQVLANKEEAEYFKLTNTSGTGGGNLVLQGSSLSGTNETSSWTLHEIAGQQLVYAHPGSLHPTVDRFRLRLIPDAQRIGYHRWNGAIKLLRRRRSAGVSESELELPVRIVRLYENAREKALKKDVTISIQHGAAYCFTSEQLVTPATLEAARSDFIDLKFIVKMQPSQGRLVRRSMLFNWENENSTSAQHRRLFAAEDDFEEAELRPWTTGEIEAVSLFDLETGDVCYISLRRDSRSDEFELQQETGQGFFPPVTIGINILPRPKYQLMRRSDPSQPPLEVAETVNFAVIDATRLRYALRPTRQWLRSSAQNLVPLMPNTSAIVYRVISQPRFLVEGDKAQQQQRKQSDAGRLVSLAAMSVAQLEGDMALRPGLTNLLRELEPTGLSEFTQEQIDTGDLVYVPPTKDLGPSDQLVEFRFTVSAPGLAVFGEDSFRLKVIAEDNQKPVLKALKPLEVHRDGDLVLDSDVVSLSDEDSHFDRLAVRLTKAPNHGGLYETIPVPLTTTSSPGNATTSTTSTRPTVNRRKINEGEEIPASALALGKLSYVQDGSNVKEDSFNLTATDGHQESLPLLFQVSIRPRILVEPTWSLLVNNSIIVKENTTVILHPSVFPHLTPPVLGGPRFFVVVPPTKGKLLLDKRRKTSQFSTNDVANSRISYSHGPAEIGTESKVDLVRIWDFKTGKIFSLNFTLIPVNSQPPVITAVNSLQVKEGGSIVLSHEVITVRDPDTMDSQIQVKLVIPPKWGHLELQPNNITSLSTTDFAFTAEDIATGRVSYVNSLHRNGLESVSDTFSLRAYDSMFPSRESTPFHVAIHPVNDEVPSLQLVEYFSVPLNGRRVLTPYLFSVSDLDVPRDILQITFPQLPRYGHLTIYWQHGEQYTISEASAPIAESYLGMMNIVYIQNASIVPPAKDNFTVCVSDGLHQVKKSATVLIRQGNRYVPEMRVTDEGGLVLEGLAWRQLNQGLQISDRDTVAEDLVITVVRGPKMGQLERLQRHDSMGITAEEDLLEAAMDRFKADTGGPVKELKQGDRFTKRQLDTGRIYYTYTGEYTSNYVYDSISLSVSDGQYEIGPIDLPIRIRATKGRITQVVQSQESLNAELLDRNRQYADTLLSDAASETMDIKSQEPGTNDILLDNFKVSVLERIEVPIGERIVLAAGEHIKIEQIGNVAEIGVLLPSARFQHLESEASRHGSCLRLLRANANTNSSIAEFTYEDVTYGLIVLSAESCFNKPLRETVINLLLSIPTQRPTSISLHVEISGEGDNLPRPTISFSQPISIIPGADTPLTLSHISLQDSGLDPTKIYLYSKSNGSFHWRHNCSAITTVFCFFNIINEDVIYHHQGTTGSSEPTLLLANFNQLDIDLKNDHVERFIESVLALKESSPLMQYIRADSPDHITSEPITLRVETDDLYSHVMASRRAFTRAPGPDELTRIRPGEMGFFLTPKHMLSPDPSTTYTLDPKVADRRVVVDVNSGEALQQFTQEDVNRLRLALTVFSSPLQARITPVGRQKTRLEAAFDLPLSLYLPGSGQTENISLSVYWAQVGFDRKRYRICANSGLLTLPLIRRGALGHRVEVYVGLDGVSDLAGVEVDLISPKLLTFEPDEVIKDVRIRLTLSHDLLSERLFFTVSTKAPSAAVLDGNSQANVIISGKKQCHNPPFFAAFNGNSVKDESQSPRRVSLHDWLASNAIPDSNALNKAYLKSMRRSKLTSAFSCEPSWTLFQSHCYRLFADEKLSWLEARNRCEGEHGYLASVTDEVTSNWLKSFLRPFSSPVWIGLHKPVVNGPWVWHSMEQASFNNWDSGFPRQGRNRQRSRRNRRRASRHLPVQTPIGFGRSTFWSSSSAYSLHRPPRSVSDDLDHPRPMRMCVSLNPSRDMTWQNAACTHYPKQYFVCMKNPN